MAMTPADESRVDAAARGRFVTVAVVMEGIAQQLCSALRAIRRGTDARILLLARMHEEPIARRLVEPGDDGSLADAYLICPTCLTTLCAPGGSDQGREAREQTLIAGTTVNPQAEVPLAELERRIRYLERLATTDDLTGLKNRRYLWEFARQILDHARQTRGRVTLLVFDIDDFKHYNDVYGHLTGDEILRQAALLMRRCCRSHDVVGRIGGDEFAVVFWDDPCRTGSEVGRERRSATAEHPREPILLARRFQKEFGHADLRLLGPDGRGVLTISGGLASFPRDGATVQQLFERADLALREAKGSGKNRIYLVGEPPGDIAKIE
ncbi:MAG: GGDEF domain-containing protein [Planctomycetes bacterium]|nr:GGDEF domain-containing protein [Planctomycetota bacterium]